MRLQADNEFQQTKIKDLNKKYNDTCLQQVNNYQKLRRYLTNQNLKKQRQQ